MKKITSAAALLLAFAMIFSLAACVKAENKVKENPPEKPEGLFDFSAVYNKNGYLDGIKASDYVTLPSYDKISVSRSEVDEQLELFRSQYPEKKELTEGTAKDGSTVNIDYTGYVDGEAFENGSTNNGGTEVTIGVTNYIEGFLDQIIGHSPGDEFDINVTFPEDYSEASLAGKDAVFKTKLNKIIEYEDAVLDDAYVKKNFAKTPGPSYSWETVKDMEDYIIRVLAENKLFGETKFSEDLPDGLINYFIDIQIEDQKRRLASYGVSFEDALKASGSDEKALRENLKEPAKKQAESTLFIQAIAEKEKIKVKIKDIKNFIKSTEGTAERYDAYVMQMGLPYVKWVTLSEKAIDKATANAVAE